MLDYSPQINKYLQSQMHTMNPQLQQLVQTMTPQQMNTLVQQSPQLQQALEATDVQTKPDVQRFLDKLQEESSEIIQAVSKIRRFGPDNHHPDRKLTNKQELIAELEDFLALVAVLEGQGYFDLNQSRDQIKVKAEALLK
jgi:NTP pyrophosphatase (non-canonical NTP hydrolase)